MRLIALATAGFASVAHAQSSVTLFGVVDATFAHGSGSIGDKTQLTSGGYNSNRLGFRGVEDLGNGWSAQFWLEAQIYVDDGRGGPSNTNNQASGAGVPVNGQQPLTFSRRSTVGIAGPIGEFRLGRDYVPQYRGFSAGDPFGNVGVGATVNYTAAITGVTKVRASNSLAYYSPSFAGFSVNLMHYLGENVNGTPNSSDGDGSGVRIVYDKGPLSGGFGYGRTKYASGDVLQRNLQAQWNFGFARVTGVVNRDRAGTLSAKGMSIGAIVPYGVHEFKVAYSTHKTSAAGNPGAKMFAAGYLYHLSKRTALYMTVARLKNRGGSALALNGSLTGPNTSSRGYDLGLRHAF